MTICTDHYQEVCYDSKDCPACQIQNELDAANEKIAELQEQIEELNRKE